MKYKLLVLDIDGTVTNSQKEVTKKQRKPLYACRSGGFRLLLHQEDRLRVFIK